MTINKLFSCGVQLQQEKKDLIESKKNMEHDIRKIMNEIDDVKEMIIENQKDMNKVQHQVNQKEEYIAELNIYLK